MDGVNGGRLRAAMGSLSTAEWGRFSAMAVVIAALNLGGWGIFVFAVLPHHFRYQGLGLGVGVAFTAWTLGARHAFDADHISAIDNVTRKLMAEGKRPLSSGFFFALGHSSIVTTQKYLGTLDETDETAIDALSKVRGRASRSASRRRTRSA